MIKTQILSNQSRMPLKGQTSISPITRRKRRRYRRALEMITRHLTFKRLSNAIIVEIERILSHTQVRGHPYSITIDPTNYCNLHCPLCATGSGVLSRPQKMLALNDFKRFIDQVSEYAFEISLMNWGEPLLNSALPEMIRYCHAKRLSTSLSTNLTRLKLEDVDRLLISGLDYMTVSIDGTTQDVYQIYRVGGKLNVVLGNLQILLKRRAELKLKSPWIRWQFIIMKHNEHQVNEARQMAEQIGADEITFIPVGVPFGMPMREKVKLAREWFAEQPQNRAWDPEHPNLVRGGRCPYLYRTMTVNPDGGVSPCCIIDSQASDFGNMLQDNSANIWNNRYYVSARSVQTGQGVGMANTICHRCPLYKRDKGVVAGIKFLFSI